MLNCERAALWKKPLSVQLVGVSMSLDLLMGLSTCVVARAIASQLYLHPLLFIGVRCGPH